MERKTPILTRFCTAPSATWRLVCVALALTASGFPGLAGAAEQTSIAVLSFNGPQGERVKNEVTRQLLRKYDVVSEGKWEAAASKLFAHSRSAEDIAAVATFLNLPVVITGAVKKDPSWVLIVTVRQGATGKAFDKLRIPLHSQHVDAATYKQIAGELPSLIEAALATPTSTAPIDDNSEATNPPTNKTEEESPLLAQKPPEKSASQPRPKWAPYIDASVAFALIGRNFNFGNEALPQFHSSVTAGLRIDATIYPLAFLAQQPGAGRNAAQGLGVGVSADIAFWPDSIPCNRDPSNNCATTSERYATSEWMVETGLRWHWNILNRIFKPELQVSIEYGRHDFSVRKRPDGTDVGPPDVNYQYLTFGVGTRLPIVPMLAVLINFHYHLLLDTGSIQSAQEYGPGGGWGVRIYGGFEVLPWRGLTLRLAGFYEQFGLSFDQSPTPTGGATDQYYGMFLGIGYMY